MPYVPGPTWGASLTPPVGFIEARRTSKVWPSPVVEPTTGRVTNWDIPTSEQYAFCGYLQVRVNGVDVTWLEAGTGGPATVTQVLSWEIAEPFDDASCVINFPTIYPWDKVPSWLVNGCDIDLIWKQTGEADRIIFEGLFISEETSIPGPGTLTIHCLGALYQLDLFVEPPPIKKIEKDCGAMIADVVTDARRASRVVAPVTTFMDAKTERAGSFDSALTGAIQSLLTIANVKAGSRPWTVMKTDGRQMVIKKKKVVYQGADWTVSAGAPGVSAELSRDLLSAATATFAEGTAADGCRWRNMKTPAYTNATPATDPRYTTDEARIMPVYSLLVTEPYTYLPDGTITGANGFFDPTVLQVEKFVSAGERISLKDFSSAASLDLINNWEAGFKGTITLTDDPEEGHRRWIRAGENIRLRYFRGKDLGIVFHISRCEVNHLDGTVTLTVDEKSQDISAVDALIARARDANDASKRGLRNQRASQAIEERFAPWDCEAGSGRMPPTAVTANTWKIVRVGAGEAGEIVRSSFRASIATTFSIAVFGYKITTARLTANGNPFTTLGYWTDFQGNVQADKPIIAWGGLLPNGVTESAGFYPGKESEGATLTGVFAEDASWNFVSTTPPWLWVAIYAQVSCVIQGGTVDDKYTAFRASVL